jgi:hypothetical protein
MRLSDLPGLLLNMNMLPPPAWATALCGLLGVVLAIFNSRSDDRTTRRPRRLAAFGLACSLLLVLVIGGRVALRLPGVPYNVRELAGRYPTLTLVALSVALMACGGLPTGFASLLRRRPYAFAKLFFPLAVSAASVVFVVTWLAVPVESIDDIVGTPVLTIGDTLERWLRFVGLFIGPLAAWTIGARLALRDLRASSLAVGLAVATAVMLISYVVVVPLAATDNIYELLRGQGGIAAAVGVAGYLIVLSTVFASLAWSVVMAKGRFAVIVPLLMLVLSVPVGWQLVVLASNPRLDKYDRVFSARQFLLSPDRDHYLDDQQIFQRFAIVHVGLLCVLASGSAVVLAMGSADRRGADGVNGVQADVE